MKDRIYHSINLFIMMAQDRKEEALDYYLETLLIYFSEEDFRYIITEVIEYLRINDNETIHWLEEQRFLVHEGEGEEYEEDYEKFDMNNYIGREYEYIEDGTKRRFSLEITDTKNIPDSLKDIEHFILDEGFKKGIDYRIYNKKIKVRQNVLEFLKNFYDYKILNKVVSQYK